MKFIFYRFSLNQKLTLAHQQMTADHEKLKQDEADKSSKLQELMSVSKYSSPNSLLSPNRQYYSTQFLDNLSMLNNTNNTTSRNFDLVKLHKNLVNSNTRVNQKSSYPYYSSPSYNPTSTVASCMQCCQYSSNSSNSNNKSLLSSIFYALPTLHFHLLLSLTMMLLTHRCPQYLLVL